MKAVIVTCLFLLNAAAWAAPKADSQNQSTEVHSCTADKSPLSRFSEKTQLGGPECRHASQECTTNDDCCSNYCGDGPALNKICYGG